METETENVKSINNLHDLVPAKEIEPTKKESKKKTISIDQFMKSLNNLPTDEMKLSAVCKNYAQTLEDNKKLQQELKLSSKRTAQVAKEKDQLQHDLNRTVLLKSKLEDLCRELQKQNKAIKDESLVKIREEEERRKETQSKFQNTVSEIMGMLQQNNEKNAKLREDNVSMAEKFKGVLQQYQLREQQVEKMSKQMALEQQLSETKIQKSNLEHEAEKNKLLADMEHLKMELAQNQAKMQEMQGLEAALKSQIAIYADKYEEFQGAMTKSNQVFGGFKTEMEKMSKKILKLEKESLSWKKRWETTQAALITMCSEKDTNEQQSAAVRKQLQHMQNLCRTLQAERTVLVNTLKEHNIERPPVPVLPPMPLPPVQQPNNNAKVETMAANCAQLKQSLTQLQNQLNVLTNKQEEKVEKKKKNKKNKNKETINETANETDSCVDETPIQVDESSSQPDEGLDKSDEGVNKSDEVVNKNEEVNKSEDRMNTNGEGIHTNGEGVNKSDELSNLAQTTNGEICKNASPKKCELDQSQNSNGIEPTVPLNKADSSLNEVLVKENSS